MKITGVKIEKLLLELTSPFRVAFGTITHSENVMIKVTTDEGVTGYGEAAPLAFVTAETTDSVIAALELFRTGLIGMDPLDIEAVHAMMDGLMGGNSSAKRGGTLPCTTIRGKAAGHAPCTSCWAAIPTPCSTISPSASWSRRPWRTRR